MRRAALILAAAWSTALAAQDSGMPPRRAEPVTLAAGWLEETIGGDLEAACRTYQAVARDRAAASDERGQALLRLIEIDLVRGDAASFEQRIELASDEDIRTWLREKGPALLVEEAAELRAALRDGDDAKAAALRPRVEETLGRAARSWRWNPSAFGRPATRGEERREEDAPELDAAGVRLRAPLAGDPEGGVARFVRDRAARITELRLLGRADEADRLERDIIERLLAARLHSDLGPAAASQGAGDPVAVLRAARARIARVLARGRLTALERRALQTALERATELGAEGRHAEAVAMLAELPYAGLLEGDEPADPGATDR